MNQAKQIRKVLADLTIQSMLFDMDIDYETLTLEDKRIDETPTWLKKWKEKEHGKDYTVIDNGF